VSEDITLADGCWGWEHDLVTVGGRFAWTSGRSTILLPAARPHSSIELRLAGGTRPASVEILDARGGGRVLEVPARPTWFGIGDDWRARDVINSAGTVLTPDGRVVDVDFLELDAGLDAPSEVFGWSGAAVLLRTAYLDDVGTFDPRYFLYFEDTDLALRGRLRGWTYWCEPASIVRHDHSATTSAHPQLVRHLVERNRLLMLTKLAPARPVREALGDLMARTLTAAYRDLVLRSVAGRRPVTRHVVSLGRVLVGYGRLLPHALRERGRLRRAAQADLRRWRRMRRLSFSVAPPHTPSRSREERAYSRHGCRTGQTPQTDFATSASSSEAG
jgi:hypothetical protein